MIFKKGDMNTRQYTSNIKQNKTEQNTSRGHTKVPVNRHEYKEYAKP